MSYQTQVDGKITQPDLSVVSGTELQMFEQALRRHPNLNTKQTRQLLSYTLDHKLKKQHLIQKVKEIQDNVVLQQAMKEDYIKFTQHMHLLASQHIEHKHK